MGVLKMENKIEIDKDTTFEQALARLEKIVRALEQGNVPLDELLKLYDEGTALTRFCTSKLESAEKKVKLLQSKDGVITQEDFGE